MGGLGPRPELAKQAFLTDAGEVGEIVTEPTGYTIFVVEEHVPSAIPELYTVRRKVEADLRSQRAGELAKKRAEELLAKLKAQPDLDAVAQQDNLKVEESTQIGSRRCLPAQPRQRPGAQGGGVPPDAAGADCAGGRTTPTAMR